MDMEAGIEHLGRGTASATDKLIVVVEPGRRSVETAHNIKRLASEIGLDRIFLVGNKIRGEADRAFLEKYVTGFDWLGFLPYDEAIIECDLKGNSPYDTDTEAKEVVRGIARSLMQEEKKHRDEHSHEHSHTHLHEHRHGDLTHAHEHVHLHTHEHPHANAHGKEAHGHDRGHQADHGTHNHDHPGHESDPHDHSH